MTPNIVIRKLTFVLCLLTQLLQVLIRQRALRQGRRARASAREIMVRPVEKEIHFCSTSGLLPGVCGVESRAALATPPPGSLFILLSRGPAAAQVAAASTSSTNINNQKTVFAAKFNFCFFRFL